MARGAIRSFLGTKKFTNIAGNFTTIGRARVVLARRGGGNANAYIVRKPELCYLQSCRSRSRDITVTVSIDFFMNIHGTPSGVIPCKILRLLSRNQPIWMMSRGAKRYLKFNDAANGEAKQKMYFLKRLCLSRTSKAICDFLFSSASPLT